MSVKLVIFDLDGTLINAYGAVYRSVNYVMREFGYARVSGETITRTVGWGERHLLASFMEPQDVDPALKVYRKHHREALKKGTKLLPGAKRLLRYLEEQGYKMAVASNRPTETSKILIKHLDIEKYFDYVLCGDKVARPKPYPDILKKVLAKFSCRPSEAIYVGDMSIDAEAGKRARVKTLIVLTGSSKRKDVMPFKPYAVMKNVYEVAGVLGGL